MSTEKVIYHYDETRLVPEPLTDAHLNDENPPVADVKAAFANIETKGSHLAAWDAGKIPGLRYTGDPLNKGGYQNHFQGIQRLRSGPYVVISGGDVNEKMSHLFIFKMASRQNSAVWGSNLLESKKPPADDALSKVIGIDPYLWHAGGISVLGDILAVPIESSTTNSSKIVFFYLQDPENPQLFSKRIDRPDGKAGAVALTKLLNGYYLAAVWSDSDQHPRRLEFYLSESTNFFDGFRKDPWRWLASDVSAASDHNPNFSNFQNINFINQQDGKLFLLGTHNTSDAAPVVPGDDFGDLYELSFPDSLFQQNPELSEPVISKVANKKFICKHEQCNLDAAAGVYIDTSGRLNVYGGFHFRLQGLIRFSEYRSKT
ncbi:MAG: hypothetical protein ACE5IR_10720 [bacterium]